MVRDHCNILIRIPGMLYATATDPIISGSRTTRGFEEEVNVDYISIQLLYLSIIIYANSIH